MPAQFEHLPWDGFVFYDLIFPLFLFLAGVVLPFSLDRRRGLGRAAAYRRIARRTALLFLCGLLYNDLLFLYRKGDLPAGLIAAPVVASPREDGENVRAPQTSAHELQCSP